MVWMREGNANNKMGAAELKKLLWILPFVLFACQGPTQISRGVGDRWYVATTGSDSHGKGTLADPWLTIKHAADTITGAAFYGDTIMVGAGTFTENSQIALGAQVSLKGQGSTSILVLTYVSSSSAMGCIQLASNPTEGTNGNQSISHLYIDGDLTGTNAIVAYCRSNVSVHDCTIIDFAQSGVTFRGNNASGEATTKATGNKVYNCTITNSSTRGAVSDGLIRLSSQTNMDIYDNILDQRGKAEGSNGNIVDAVGGYNSDIRYYHNKSYKPFTEGAAWNFHIESWNGRGGWHVYDNEFHGGGCHIDIGGNSNVKGSYAYSWWVHDNLFSQDALQSYNAGGYYTMAVDLERNVQDAIIERNHIRRLNWGVYLTADEGVGPQRNHIRYNLFEEIGTTDNIYAAAVMMNTVDAGNGPTDTYIDNNTMTAGAAYNVGAAVLFANYNGNAERAYIRNNIIKGFMRPVWVAATTNPDTVYYQNNHSNNTSDAIYYSSGRAIGTLISANNQTGDPLFRSGSLRLSSTSPAINAGTNVSLTSDYFGHSVPQNDSVDIGAHEYGNYLTKFNGKFLRDGNGKLKIMH